MSTSTPLSDPSSLVLTPSELVLIHGENFATPRPVKSSELVTIVLLIVCFVSGLFMSYSGGVNIMNAWASNSWPTVKGRITRSALIQTDKDDTPMYKANLRYEYEMVGLRTGTSLSFGSNGKTSNKNSVVRVLNRYKVGDEAQISVDPKDPNRAVLEPGLTLGSFAIAIIGIIFSVIPTIALITRAWSLIRK